MTFARPVTALVLALCLWSYAARALTVDPYVADTLGDAPETATAADYEALVGDVLDRTIGALGDADAGARRGPQEAFQQFVWRAGRPGAEDERAAVSRAVSAAIQAGEGVNEASRMFLLRQLEFIGRRESVPALMQCLLIKEGHTRECARRALVRNPSDEAGNALRAALAGAREPDWRVALLQALAARPEAAGQSTLAQAAQTGPAAQRMAAYRGLAAIGDAASAPILKAALADDQLSAAARAVASDCYLLLADALCEAGDRERALPIYKELLGSAGHRRCAAIVGVGRAGGRAELAIIFDAFDDPDASVRGAARSALALLPAAEIVAVVRERYRGVSVRSKLELLQALHASTDPGVLPIYRLAAKEEDDALRVAAYEGMGCLGDAAAADVLVAALTRETDAVLGAARTALARTPGDEVVAELQTALAGAAPAGRRELVNTIATRSAAAAAPVLIRVAGQDQSTDVRQAALSGLARIARTDDGPALLQLLLAARGEAEREKAKEALVAVSRRAENPDVCAEQVLAVLADARRDVRPKLIRALGPVGGDKARTAVLKALRDGSDDEKMAAVRALGEWPDTSVLDDLMAVTADAPNLIHKVLAVRGYVRIVQDAGDLSDEAKLERYKLMLATAPRADEKKLVLAGVAELNTADALDVAQAAFDDEALAEEAAVAVTKTAAALRWDYPVEAMAALQRVAKDAPREADRKAAADTIADIRRYAGYIRTWLASGPYTEKGKSGRDLHTIPLGPETDASREELKWRVVRTGSKPKESWYLPLDSILRGGDRVAYVRTWLYSSTERAVKLEMSSDDGVIAWVNREVMLDVDENRAHAVGQNSVDATLAAGWNELLMKVDQSGGGWVAAARVVTPAGEFDEAVLTLDSSGAVDASLAAFDNGPASARDAEAAYDLSVASGIPPAKAAKLLRGVITGTTDEDIRAAATKTLTDLEASQDHITSWELSGPHTAKSQGGLFDEVFAPEKGTDAGEWSPFRMQAGSSRPWIVDFKRIYGGEQRVAYMRTTVVAQNNMDARMEIGSDDGVKIWLNGELVHSNNVARPVRPCEDKFPVKLRKGENSVMIKVVQDGGDWAACARFRTPDGSHLDGWEAE